MPFIKRYFLWSLFLVQTIVIKLLIALLIQLNSASKIVINSKSIISLFSFRANYLKRSSKMAQVNEHLIGTRLAPFKSSANYFDPKLPRERPVVNTTCAKCTAIKSNKLLLNFNYRNRNLISRSFYYASYVMSRKVDSHYPEVAGKVIRSGKVQTAIKESAIEEFNQLREDEAGLVEEEELKTIERKQRSRAIEILQRMKSCISSSLLRIAGWVLYKLLSKMLTTIQFHEGQIERIRRCRTSSANIPIVYLPLHRSHLDYILVSFILYMNNIKPPLVAAGDNLLIPFFGNLMRGLGAFFIKRRLDHSDGKRDHLYRAVLQTYINENLKSGNSLEFFIEGGRSRTGKVLTPKSGLLSVIVDSVLDGSLQDVFIVPIAISYEKLMDGTFVAEQLGKPKTPESFTLAARSIWSTLHTKFGSVRVDFCNPFSLKDYLHNSSFNTVKSNNILNKQHNHQGLHCVACNGNTQQLSAFESIYGLDVIASEDKRHTIEKLAQHVVYDAFNALTLMSTQMVAFLLLTKHRKGATLHQLAQSLNWFREECNRRNRDVCVTGDSLDVIRNACLLLGKDLVSIEKVSMAWSSSDSLGGPLTENNNVKIVFLKPSVKLPHVLELQYYANSCISLFQLDSVIVNAMFALINNQLDGLSACGDNMESHLCIDYNDLIDKSIQLCDILHNDFLLAPPCVNIRDKVTDTVENMIMFGILTEAHKDVVADYQLKQRFRHFEFDDDGEEDGYIGGHRNGFNIKRRELRIVLTDENKESLLFYRSVLAAYIESYWVAASTLPKLIGSEAIDEETFFNQMIDIAKEKQQKGLLFHEECIALDPFKNAVKLFESWNLLIIETINGVRHLRLRPEFNSVQELNDVILRIEDFKI